MTETLTCRCGATHIELSGAPFITTSCYCASCQQAAARLGAFPVIPPMAAADGGTAFRLYRKDRAVLRGQENLAAFRLTPESKTRRFVATCCMTPMFAELPGGHWLSVYNGLWPDAASFRPEILTQTADAPDPAHLPDIPHGGWPTARFYGRLLAIWIAMGFRTPDLGLARELQAPEPLV